MALDLDQHGALVDRFSVAKLDYVLHAEHSTAETTKLRAHEEAGQKSESVAGVQKSSAKATKDAQNSKEAVKRRQLEALLEQLSALGNEIDAIAEQIAVYDRKIDAVETAMIGLSDGSLDVDDALSDPDVAQAVKDWEARTGKKFDPNADNAADVLVAILGVQRDEYLAERNALVERHNDLVDDYNGIARKVPDIDERYKIEPREAKAETLALAEESHLAALAVQAEAEEAELAAIGVSVDDGAFEFEQREADTEQALDGTISLNIGGGLNGLDGTGTFNTAAAPAVEFDDSEFEIADGPKVGGLDAS